MGARSPIARAAVVISAVGALLAGGSALALPAFRGIAQDFPGGGSSGPGKALVASVRALHRPSFDRLVFTFRGGRPGGHLRQVAHVVADASGLPVPLLGTSFLTVQFLDATAVAGSPQRRLAPTMLTPRMRMVRQVKLAGDFEGSVTYGIGLTRRARVRVFGLSHPDRIVVDVAPVGG